jgi:hypothetical protein
MSALIGFRPWTPYDGDPYSWWDAKDEGTITKDGSNRVSQVRDKSGNGWDIIQSLGAFQPLYVGGSSPHLYFDGARALGRFDTMGITGNPAMTVFVVAQNDSDAIYRIIQWGNGGGQSLAICPDSGARYNDGNNVWSDSPMLGTTDTGAFTFPAGGTYGDSTFHLIGTEASVTGQSNPTNTVNIGGTYMGVGVGYTAGSIPTNFFAGKLHEMIVVLAELDDDERQRYEGYLVWRWGKQASLPLGHQYKDSPPIA